MYVLFFFFFKEKFSESRKLNPYDGNARLIRYSETTATNVSKVLRVTTKPNRTSLAWQCLKTLRTKQQYIPAAIINREYIWCIKAIMPVISELFSVEWKGVSFEFAAIKKNLPLLPETTTPLLPSWTTGWGHV